MHIGESVGDFADVAAIVDQLDLVIAVDSTIAYLAGALGKPVWILLCFAADWCWFIGRDDSPWYPTARLQQEPGHWGTVIERVKALLPTLVKRVTPPLLRVRYRPVSGVRA
jgi:hypothetical protein